MPGAKLIVYFLETDATLDTFPPSSRAPRGHSAHAARARMSASEIARNKVALVYNGWTLTQRRALG